MPVLEATDTMMEMAKKDVPRKEDGVYCKRNLVVYKYGLYMRAMAEGELLKIAFFLTEYMRAGSKNAIYELFIDKKVRDFIGYDVIHDKWSNAKLDRIEWPDYVYHSSGKYIDPESDLILKKFINCSEGSYQDIQSYQFEIRKEQLIARHKKETDAWDQKLAQTPHLPKDWGRWVDKVGITENFIFYKYVRGGAKEGYCTWCEKKVPIRNPKYGKEGKCKCCGHKIKYKSVGKYGRFATDRAVVYLLQRCQDGFMIREFNARRYYRRGKYREPDRICNEVRRVIYDKELNSTAFYYGLYKQQYYRWIKMNSCTSYSYYFPQYKGKTYRRSLVSLGKHELARTGYIQMLERTGGIDPEIYMAKLKAFPYMEQLVKAGLIKMAKELLHRSGTLEMKGSRELGKALGIDKQRLKRLRMQNGGMSFLTWLRFEKEQGKNIADDVISWFVNEKISPEDIAFIAGRMSEVQVKNYLVRQMNESGCSSKSLISTWEDYLSMAKRLKMNINDAIIYRVKELVKRHKEMVLLIEENEAAIRAEEIAELFPHVNRICKEIKEKYTFENEKYAILVPNGIEDILNEGMALHHCIDKSDRYYDRINSQESFILFLRKKEAIDQPFYTLEIEPAGTIRQKRTEYDRQNADIKDAEPFLRDWQKEVSKRMTAMDHALAIESKEIRIKEFEEMRKNNVKIHGGLYAGRMLADVLEEDLLESEIEKYEKIDQEAEISKRVAA